MQKLILCLVTLLTPVVSVCADERSTKSDPLAPILRPHLKPTIAILLDHYRAKRKYMNLDFPMSKDQFTKFKSEMKTELARTLGITDWVVRNKTLDVLNAKSATPRRTVGKTSPIADQFEDHLIKTISLHSVTVELHAVTLLPTGLVVPMALCLPNGDKTESVPGVCVFSGHTPHGLHDLVVNLDSYQQGVAVRLAQAGFASIAVEKIDTGYLSRNGTKGNDEHAAATLMLSWGSVLRSHQLRACLAATEILAGHTRVDESRIGATGVSLGGWLAVQTAMLNDRIKAVADFGMKTRSISADIEPKKYQGQRDLCHIIPGMLRLSDRNLMPVVLAPTAMLAGHGRNDGASQRGHASNYRTICEAQYSALDAAKNYSYLIHSGGDTMPSKEAIDWFKQRFLR